MNNNVLKSAITAVIKQNGNEEITGDILQQTLIAMVDALGGNYQFAGIARSDTAPGTPDQHVFYLAAEAGTAVYANFGGIAVDKEICALCFVTSWTKMSLVSFDEEPTEDSGNLVSSGAIFQALENLASYVEDAFMPKVPTAVENNIATFDGAGNVKDSGKSFDAFLPADGIAMASGLIDVISVGTDQEFLNRKSGGDGVAFYKGIKGKSIVWNQLCDPANNVASNIGVEYNGITVDYDNATGKYRVHGTATANYDRGIIEYQNTYGHFYLLSAQGLPTGASGSIRCYANTGAGNEVFNGDIKQSTLSGATPRIYIYVVNGASVDMYFSLNIHDLTIANLAGLTFAQFKALYPGYHGYNPGIMKNNDADRIESEGFNLWDEEWRKGYYGETTGEYTEGQYVCTKNPIKILGGQTYYFYCGSSVPNIRMYVSYYDTAGNLINTTTWSVVYSGHEFTVPINAVRMNFWLLSAYGTTYNHDICINISDPDRNGTYEPYWKKDIQIGLNALRVIKDGVEKVINGLDGVNSAFDLAKADMDGYVRVLDKRMAEVDLGDLTWTNSGSIFLSTGLNSLMKFPTGLNGHANGVCSMYGGMISYGDAVSKDKVIYSTWPGAGAGLALRVNDSAYSDPAAFKTAMRGVKLRYEMKTPIHYELVEPFFAGIMVDEDGTEKAIAPSAATTPSAPFVAQTTYTISIPNLVKKLSTI